ncbi:MAG: hypothetical protein KDC08_10810 [Actinobacteria bacterium]|nr:hypothetical protein [Actinomycetota bacterium]
MNEIEEREREPSLTASAREAMPWTLNAEERRARLRESLRVISVERRLASA